MVLIAADGLFCSLIQGYGRFAVVGIAVHQAIHNESAIEKSRPLLRQVAISGGSKGRNTASAHRPMTPQIQQLKRSRRAEQGQSTSLDLNHTGVAEHLGHTARKGGCAVVDSSSLARIVVIEA